MVSEEGSWAGRVKLAVLILDLLQEIDTSVAEGFSLCDVKPSHFGISPSRYPLGTSCENSTANALSFGQLSAGSLLELKKDWAIRK